MWRIRWYGRVEEASMDLEWGYFGLEGKRDLASRMFGKMIEVE